MEKSCAECSEPTLAQSLCTLCNKWLCYQCTDVHQHQKAPTTSHYGDSQPQEGPGASQRPELHPSSGQGPGSYPCPLLMCHSHRQEPLELFCESCDLLCCSSCHLSSHKNHRMVQISKALQDQQWLFESLMVRQEEKRSAVENNAKQMEDRLHGVKIAHRKAENQIKMAKMIMMNELNKRANLLIEQLQKISEDFQQRLEDQLQGAIEACGQLDHVQKFITWATKQHSRGPVLFSRALISLQMQQLLEPSIPSDCWSPIKIRFDWDASYWMKQISTLGQLTVEGGNCTYPQGMSCSSVHRPQPIACLALPTVCHRGREPGCGYQDCCEPHMCCLHGIASQPDPSGADKRQLEARFYNPSCNSSCVQPALTSASLPQRCWDPDSLAQCPPSSSPVPTMGPLPISCSRGSVSIPQATVSQPKAPMKSHLYYQDQIQIPPDSQAQSSAEHSRPGQCQEKLWTSTALQRDFSHKASDRDVMTEEIWQDRCRVEEVVGQTKSRDLLREDQQDRRIQQQQQLLASPAAELSKEQQRNRAAVMPRDHRDARRSTSLEVPMTTVECAPDGHGSRLSPGMVCTRRKRRSQSIPAELAAPSSTLYSDRPSGYAHTTEAESANKYASTGHTHRRASDGLLCVVKETSSDMTPSTGHRSPLLSYKTEPDHVCTLVNEEIDYDAKEKCRVSGNGQSSNTDVQKDSARPRVPVVCLERLKILVSQLPPHGRRQSDPLPASGTGKKETLLQRRSCPGPSKEVVAGGSETSRTTHSLKAPPHTEHQLDDQSPTLYSNSGFDHRGRTGSRTSSMLPHSDLKYVLKSHSAVDLDSDSDPRTASEEGVGDSWAESSSEAEPECLAEDMSVTTGAKGFCAETDIARDSEPSLGYEADPESDAGAGSEDGQGLEADGESGDAETELDTQPDCNPRFQAETDSDIVSDQHPDSHGSLESELNVESEREPATDDPQPLRSDLEEDSHFGSGPRQLLIANPAAHRDEEVQSDQDNADMESEDFCAVCLIGGDLLCCDRCPKVFHLSCHIPSLLSFPSGDWLCSLCRDVVLPEVEYDCENERRSGEQTVAPGLTACDQRNCERLTLVILSNVLSAPFQEPVSPLARHYYQIIKRPMDLSVIRAKLNRRNARHYNSPDQFVADVSLMFHNCAKFNYPDSEVAQAGRSLEAFFVSRLREVFPDRVFPADEADSDSDEYDEACRTAEGGFPWPESREQCFRKRKRRNSLKSRRHHF